MEPEYRYPRPLALALRWGALLLGGLIAARGALTLLRLLLSLVERLRPLPLGDFWRLGREPLPALVGALALLAIGLLVARVGSTLLSPLTLVEDGLYVHDGRRPRYLPWEDIDSIYATRPGGGEQVLLYLRSSAAPWTSRVTGALAGAGAVPGVLIASTLDDFTPVMSYVLRALEARRGPGGFTFEEEPSTPLLQVALAPETRFETLWPSTYRSQSVRPTPSREAVVDAGRVAAVIALALPLLLLLESLVDVNLRISPIILFVMGLIEWPVAAYWLVAVADLLDRSVDWPEMLVIYPSVQWPRWLVVALAAALLLVGAPGWTLLVAFLLGLIWQGWLNARLTRHLFGVQDARAWVGAAIPIIFQALLYGVTYLLLR